MRAVRSAMIRRLAREHAVSVAAFLAYGLIALAWTYPLVCHLASALPHDLGDPLLNAWLLYWNAHHIPFTTGWWNGPFFCPAPGVLALSDNLVGLSVIASPLQWLGASPVLAYNLVFLASFQLSAFGAHLLCLRLTRRHDAALLGGLAFAFAPYRAGQFAHLQLLWSWWMPAAWHCWGCTATWKRAGGAGLRSSPSPGRFRHSATATTCSSSRFSWCCGFCGSPPPWHEWRVTAEIVVAWGLAILPVAATLIPYARLHAWYGLSRRFAEIEGFSADLTAFFQGSSLLAHWRGLPGGVGENCLYPGITIAAIVAAGVVGHVSRRARGAASRVQWLAAGLATTFGMAALSGAVLGPWRLKLGAVSLSVSALHKPLGIAIFMVIVALLSDRRVIEAHRQRAVFVYYTGAAVAMALLSLGPTPHSAGTLFWHKAPYWWLLRLPGMTSLRVPTRFAMLGILCLAVVVALAGAEILGRMRRWRPAFVAVAAAGILWDGWIQGLPTPSVPGSLQLPQQVVESGYPILELPLGGIADVAAMYHAIEHGLPVVNGYSGHDPPHYMPLRLGLSRRDEGLLAALAGAGALHVAVDRANDERGDWERWVARQGRPVETEEQRRWAVYRIDGSAPRSTTSALTVPIRQIWANRNQEAAAKAIDGDLATRWMTGAAQTRGDKLSVDLGSPVPVAAVVVSLGRTIADFPRELAIEGSDDRVAWKCLWKGPTAGRTVKACLDDPRSTALRFELGGGVARFVRLRLTGSDPLYQFSVAELTVLAPAAEAPTTAGH